MKTDSNKPTEIIVPLGQALKDARLAASLSIDEVAEQLNFAPSTVRDFEDNLEQILQTKKYPVIYLRGYLANYAKLVGLNTLELFVEYQQLAITQKKAKKLPVSDLIIPQTKKRSKALPLFFVFVIIIVAILYFFQNELFTANQTPPTTESSIQINNQPNAQNSNVLIAKGDLVSTAINTELQTENVVEATKIEQPINEIIVPEADEKPKMQIEAVEDPIIAATSIEEVTPEVATSNTLDNNAARLPQETQSEPAQLSLAFNAECWTEVFDATGKRIAFGLYKDGQTLLLAGVAPFQLKLGDPSVVDIQYQQQVFEGEFTPGRSAQFSVPLS